MRGEIKGLDLLDLGEWTLGWKGWQTCNILGFDSWKSQENFYLFILILERFLHGERNPRNPNETPSWFHAPYFSPFLFPLYSFSPSLDLNCARTGGAAAAGRAAAGQAAAGRRPARPRRATGPVGLDVVSGFSPLSFLNLHLLEIPRFDLLIEWISSLELFMQISLEISWLFKVCSGKNLILRCIELIQLYKIDG